MTNPSHPNAVRRCAPCHPGRSERPRALSAWRGRFSAALGATNGVNFLRGAAIALGAACLAAAPGCSSTRGVPSGAALVTEATVKSSFQAPADGMLYIVRTARRGSPGQLHYSGPIGAGQILVIDPSMNKATIDGQELELVLPGGDVWYQAYFRPDRSVRKVLDERPPTGRMHPGYEELAPADASQSAPREQTPQGQQNSE